MRVLELELRRTGYTDQLAYFHPHWTRDGAPLLDELGAVIDHIAPFSKDGPDTEENLITACNKCNGRKSAALLDEWNKRPMGNPIEGKYGEPQRWDGLASVFVMLAERNASKLTKVDKDWLIALKQGER